jgi:hypothetical protein
MWDHCHGSIQFYVSVYFIYTLVKSTSKALGEISIAITR